MTQNERPGIASVAEVYGLARYLTPFPTRKLYSRFLEIHPKAKEIYGFDGNFSPLKKNAPKSFVIPTLDITAPSLATSIAMGSPEAQSQTTSGKTHRRMSPIR